jgi:hypothetical protein
MPIGGATPERQTVLGEWMESPEREALTAQGKCDPLGGAPCQQG